MQMPCSIYQNSVYFLLVNVALINIVAGKHEETTDIPEFLLLRIFFGWNT